VGLEEVFAAQCRKGVAIIHAESADIYVMQAVSRKPVGLKIKIRKLAIHALVKIIANLEIAWTIRINATPQSLNGRRQ